MRYAFGCDHAGLPLKAPLVAELERNGHEVVDFGTDSYESVDYPRFAARVSRAVSSGDADMGVLVCGTGQGMAMTANRFRGVRAAAVSESFSARMARAHNNANILCMGARVVGPGAAIEILRTWLEQGFDGGRHEHRVEQVMSPESLD
jgi:ribose 5-phosphate isomerase B